MLRRRGGRCRRSDSLVSAFSCFFSFCHFCFPSVLYKHFFSSAAHTHSDTQSFSQWWGEKCCVRHTEGLFYSCERLLCKTRARARSLEVSSQLRIIPAACVCVCVIYSVSCGLNVKGPIIQFLLYHFLAQDKPDAHHYDLHITLFF